MLETANTSFYLVQADENGTTSSKGGGDVSIAQIKSDETLNATEPPKTSANESFYFVDDKSVSVNAEHEELSLAAAAAAASEEAADSEADARQQMHDKQAEMDAETAAEALASEAPASEMPVPPTPVTSLASLHDPDSLLTSVQLVIGESSLCKLVSNFMLLCFFIFVAVRVSSKSYTF